MQNISTQEKVIIDEAMHVFRMLHSSRTLERNIAQCAFDSFVKEAKDYKFSVTDNCSID